jgi:hypothetical protein
MNTLRNTPHGFVWPDGLPNCVFCDRMANDSIHITPGSGSFQYFQRAADLRSSRDLPQRAHPYMMRSSVSGRIPCQVCRGYLKDSRHPAGMPAGMVRDSLRLAEPATLAHEAVTVLSDDGRLFMATREVREVEEGAVPDFAVMHGREVAKASDPLMWIAGRYVEANVPNRNGALWSTQDLESGEATIANGPINWLHEERHIIGSIVASEMVYARDTTAADLGAHGLNDHVVTLGAVWPWIFPQEAAIIKQASEAGTLWESMECVSEEVACLSGDCGRQVPYRDYMLQQETARCEHMQAGEPRRFVNPSFRGVGIIVPPVRPGWAHADVRVLEQKAEELIENQAAAFAGMEDADAASVATQLFASIAEPTA